MAARTILVTAILLAGCAASDATPTTTPVATATPPASRAATAQPTTTPALTPTARTASPMATPSPTTSPAPAPTTPASVGLAPFAEGFGQLVLLTHAPGEEGVVYVVEQQGRVRQGTTDGSFRSDAFLDITDRVRFEGEQGLLGLAFHPDYASDGRLFVNYTDGDGTTTVSEFTFDGDCACADPDSERVLLTIEQPFANHNGGMVAFGADGYLYISTGDGGGGGDPLDAGQDLTTLLGKMLRIDVDASTGERPYAIPPDNPFIERDDALPEIWDYGLRNPWRTSFDRQTGDLFIADVGQGSWEEVNAEPAGSGGRNYGWNVMEGPACFEPPTRCDESGLTLPVSWYATAAGKCAITGGYVYRGSGVPGLAGTYLFSDYCSGTLWGIDAARAVAGETQEPRTLNESGLNVTGFGEDAAGEVYLVTADGQVVRVVATPR